MTILDKINAYKQVEVAKNKELYPTKLLEQSIYFNADSISLKQYLLREDKSGIIAEFKRKSPSKGAINQYADPEKISIGYMQAGASALSVLTDNEFFGGSNEDLKIARKFNYCPILRKDFIIDEYQILEAKSIGADAILLIAASLTKKQIKNLTQFAKSLKLEVLMEIHADNELDKICDDLTLIGVNNRNLKTFEVNIENSIRLGNLIPKEFTKISESGISNSETIVELKKHGFEGFLIGENFMKTAEPALSCKKFIEQI